MTRLRAIFLAHGGGQRKTSRSAGGAFSGECSEVLSRCQLTRQPQIRQSYVDAAKKWEAMARGAILPLDEPTA
jgi:hypothetical protein